MVDAGAAYVFVVGTGNAAPIVNAGPDQTATENVAFHLSASFTDADASDNHIATVNWGDGSPTEGATVTEPSSPNSGTITASHTYLAPSNYTVTVTVTDSADASGSDTLQVAVGSTLSASYIQNTTTQQANANFNISGNGVVGGNLSVNGALNASGSGLTDLNAGNITTGTLDNARLGMISTANIADSAITTPKIADSAVTAAKIGSNQVVKNLNGLTDNVNLAAGANITITPSGSTLTISAAGGNFIQNTTTLQPSSNFNISGDGAAANLTASNMLSANIVNAMTQFNLGGSRVLSTAGAANLFAGNGAGNNNTTGSGNSFFGTNTGVGNTTGSNNTLIGSATNVGANNLSYATALGAGATVNTSNTITLGRSTGQDMVLIPGNLNVTGTIFSHINGGAGTQGRLTRWMDNAGTLGDAAIFESSGLTVFGQNFSGQVGPLFPGADGAHVVEVGATGLKTPLVLAGGNGVMEFWKDLGGGTGSPTAAVSFGLAQPGLGTTNDMVFSTFTPATTFWSERMRITNNGNVGIGTTTPASKLDVAGTINTLTQYNIGGSRVLGMTPNSIFVGVNAGTANTTGGGNSFVGYSAGNSNTTGSNNTIIGASANVGANSLSYATAIGAEATVSNSNTVVLGRSAGQETVLIPGLLRLNTLGTAGGSALCRNASNQIAACSSSLRYKTNIAPFSFGLNLVQRLRPIRFEWKEGGMKDVGFGAEDVAAVEPRLVTYNAKGEVEGVKYDRISTVLVNAVKEQQTQIEAQQAQLTHQQAQLEAQRQQLRQQQILIDGLKKLLCQQNPSVGVCLQ